MRAKSVARKLANNININNSSDGIENDDTDVGVGSSMAYKGKASGLTTSHHQTVILIEYQVSC